MNPTRILLMLLAGLAGLIIGHEHAPNLAAAEIRDMSIVEFVAEQKRWSDWEKQLFRLEGRYSSFAPTAMKFQNCDLFFYLPRDAARPLGRSKTVEVTGVLQRENNVQSFRVDSLRLLPDDNELFLLKKRSLPVNDPEPWYRLGSETLKRAKFYDDQILEQFARETLAGGLAIEKTRRQQLTAEFLQELAAKAATLGIPERVRLEYVHAALRLEFAQLQAVPQSNFSALRQRLGEQLPGSQIPLTSLDGTVFDKYRQKPEATYAEATDHARRQLSRLFFLDVTRVEHQRQLEASGKNGDALATAFARLAPDDPVTAEQFRARALQYRTQNIQTARRPEVLQLASEYRQQNQPEMALTALKTWLTHRLSQLDRAGPGDYVQTAVDLRDWLEDVERSEGVLLAGIARFPDDVALQAQLRQAGFVAQGTKWVRKGDQPLSPADKLDNALRAGRILPGMKPDQVIVALGAPQTLTQIVSADKTVLVWNYPDAQLAIRFEQRREQPDFQVVAVSPLQRTYARP